MSRRVLHISAVLLFLAAVTAELMPAQERLKSPPGRSAVEIGGVYDARAGYVGGKWIDIRYGRPMKRGRDLFGPDDFVEFLNDGAEVWRAGANQTTQLTTEVPLVIDGVRVEPGTYTVFIELARERWTFILSSWPAQEAYEYENKDALFGAYDYTPDRDVLRTEMTLETLPFSVEQLSWQFLDVGVDGGRLGVLWDESMASVAFSIP